MEPYKSLPWFWFEQGEVRPQMAELLPTSPETTRRAGANPSTFTLFHVVGGRLLCAVSVNAQLDHMMSCRLIEAGVQANAAPLADPSIPLKALLV